MKTQAEYEADIMAIARDWRRLVEERVAAGWEPTFAFDEAADRAAKVGTNDEATIQMMTRAAGALAYPGSKEVWQHSDAFRAWWNARFPLAPNLEGYDFRAPCLFEAGELRTGIIATWSCFAREFMPERAQA